MGIIKINGKLYGGGSPGVRIRKLTQEQYDSLPDSKLSDGVLYAIIDDNTTNGGSVAKPVELTKAQYEALGDSVLNDNILYAITDGDGMVAKNIEYDGSISGLGNNIQDAIDNLRAVSVYKNPTSIPIHSGMQIIFYASSAGTMNITMGSITSTVELEDISSCKWMTWVQTDERSGSLISTMGLRQYMLTEKIITSADIAWTPDSSYTGTPTYIVIIMN